jgi:hypothetical protein
MVCIVCYLLYYINFGSPHHGKGIADSFGGEFRKRMDNRKMKKSAYDFDSFLEICREEFNSKDCPPGSRRVTFLKFVYNLFYTIFYIFTKLRKITKSSEKSWFLEHS